jgi:hypothetical protein
VAQTLTIARGFGLEENETPLEVIRSECTRLKVYDSANFSSQLAKLAGYVVSGSGQNRRLRAKGLSRLGGGEGREVRLLERDEAAGELQ